jgi:probable F420-dependent oxidoreductase
MKLGVTFPQTEFGTDPVALRDYTQMVEQLGLNHVLAYDHVIGANPDRPGGWRGTYTHESAFLSPFLLFSYMAAVTERLKFVTGIIILPQRETVLAAKQAATLDVLCGGRLRFGIGIGWNKVEYIALNQDFHKRGKRVDEQIALLQRLWTEPLITYSSEQHTIPDAGIKPLPVQRPIPIWFGGHADAALRRVARVGEGWMPLSVSAEKAKPLVERLHGFLEEEGRDPSEIGLEPRIAYGSGGPDEWTQQLDKWKAIGATHATINTMNAGLDGPQEHMDAARRFAEAVGLG